MGEKKMMDEFKTAIISDIKIGKVDHYKGIVYSVDFDMNGTGCGLTFNGDDMIKMMEARKIYDNVLDLIGEPCEVHIDARNTCHFKGMWKK